MSRLNECGQCFKLVHKGVVAASSLSLVHSVLASPCPLKLACSQYWDGGDKYFGEAR